MPTLFPSSLRPFHRRVPTRALSAAGFALALSCGLSAASPAAAAPGDWRAGCQFRSIPGGAADGIRYDACMHQRDCQNLANAAGARSSNRAASGSRRSPLSPRRSSPRRRPRQPAERQAQARPARPARTGLPHCKRIAPAG